MLAEFEVVHGFTHCAFQDFLSVKGGCRRFDAGVYLSVAAFLGTFHV
jgi:hypothetical protein